MDIIDEEERRKKLRSFLLSLARSQDYLKDKDNQLNVYAQLEQIYHVDGADDFRHFYSDIFSVLTLIKNDSNFGNIDILGQNLTIIREHYCSQNLDASGKKIDIGDSIRKLYDHVSLDIARINYSENQNRRYLGKDSLDETKSKIVQIESELPDIRWITSEVKKIKQELKSSQKDYIAILGIFSSVVLTFTTGIAFSTSVLENIHKASIYRILFACLIIAFVLINVLGMLFGFVEKIVHDSDIIVKAKKHSPILVTNISIFIIMVIIFISWHIGAVESRNKRINNFNATQTVTTEITNSSINDVATMPSD